MIASTLKWTGGVDGRLELLDQRLLPAEVVTLKCATTEQLYDAIKTLAVRGAPAIGVAAAYGPLLALQQSKDKTTQEAIRTIEKACDYLASSRPTAVNLAWALERCKRKAQRQVESDESITVEHLKQVLLDEADAINQEDVEMCLRIGRNGQKFIKDGGAVLTHCNAGALATAGQGTALSLMFEAHKNGKRFAVYVDETRPLLQGARLTAWELQQASIDATLICDNMAGSLMKQGKVDAVITGADRIAANGDAANKIGTYSLAVLAKENNVPFYIAAPTSTFDLNIASGDEIPIELRADDEVAGFAGTRVAPADINVYNPAFDVTEAELITAIITEKCVIANPNKSRIAELFG